MSDSHLLDGSRSSDASAAAERDSKIEQLLLVGLDHYFAAQYDQAINVWTRALFLDRTHPRARAYIERARSALAERQRASEELLQNGVAAFQRGEGLEARRLLQAAIAGGAPSDEALAVLDRMDRLEAGGPTPADTSARGPRHAVSTLVVGSKSRSRTVALVVFGSVLAAAAVAGTRPGPTRRLLSRAMAYWNGPAADVPRGGSGEIAGDLSLPLPRRGQTALARARAFAVAGHLRDALAELDNVRPTDVQRPDADRLRADIQQQLLNLSSARHIP
jgi:tetratricopeptide (TPR) repeat protein